MKKYLRSVVFVFSGFIATAGLLPGASSDRGEPAGEVKFYLVQGNVTVTHADARTEPAVRGSVLSEGATIATGADGSAMLVFSNGTAIQLKPNTELRIEQYRQAPFDEAREGTFLRLRADPGKSTTLLKVVRGEISGGLKKLNTAAGSTFRVEMPDGTLHDNIPSSASR